MSPSEIKRADKIHLPLRIPQDTGVTLLFHSLSCIASQSYQAFTPSPKSSLFVYPSMKHLDDLIDWEFGCLLTKITIFDYPTLFEKILTLSLNKKQVESVPTRFIFYKSRVELIGVAASLKGEEMEVSNSWLKAISNREEVVKKKSR